MLVVVALGRSLHAERLLARQDPLTHVANSRAFRELLDAEIRRARRAQWPLSLAYVDVDDFKDVNDRFGHAVGDDVLAAVAAGIRSAVRDTDAVARLGGDEFAVVLPNADAHAVAIVIGRMRECVSDALAALPVQQTLSVGVVTCAAWRECEVGDAREQLLTWADEAMYTVKVGGKDGQHFRVIGEAADAETAAASSPRSAD